MASEKQKTQERYEFLDLSDVDEASRIQLTTALYSNEVLINNNSNINNNNNTKQDIECCGNLNDNHFNKNSINHAVNNTISATQSVNSTNLNANECYDISDSSSAAHGKNITAFNVLVMPRLVPAQSVPILPFVKPPPLIPFAAVPLAKAAAVRNKDIVSIQKGREHNNDCRAAESIIEQQPSGDMKMSPQSGNSGQSGQQQPPQPQQQQQQQQQLTIQQQNINSHQLPPHNQQPMYQPVYMAQGPNGVYQMVPQPLGSNVYVSNVTANVNLHGYVPASHPQHVIAPAYLAPADQSQNVTPVAAGAIMHENHNNNVRGNGGNNGRRVRSSNSGRNNGNNGGMNRRMEYQPNNNNNNRGHPSNQQEMMQHQPQAMMEPQPVQSYPQYYTIPYHNPHHGAPAFYAAPPPHMGGHPSTQHATGTPLYIASPMQIHGYPQMYYPQGVMYQPIIQPQEYQPIVDPEEKGEPLDGGNQQQITWQGQAQIVEYNEQSPQQQHAGAHHEQNDQEYQPQEINENPQEQSHPPNMVHGQVQMSQHILNPNVPNFVVGPPPPPPVIVDNGPYNQKSDIISVDTATSPLPPMDLVNNNQNPSQNIQHHHHHQQTHQPPPPQQQQQPLQQQQPQQQPQQQQQQPPPVQKQHQFVANQNNPKFTKENVQSVVPQPPQTAVDVNANTNVENTKTYGIENFSNAVQQQNVPNQVYGNQAPNMVGNILRQPPPTIEGEPVDVNSNKPMATNENKLMIKNNRNNKPPAWNNVGNVASMGNKKSTASVAVSAIPNKENEAKFKSQVTSTVSQQSQQQQQQQQISNAVVQTVPQQKIPPPPFTTNTVKMNPTSPTVPAQQQHTKQAPQQHQPTQITTLNNKKTESGKADQHPKVKPSASPIMAAPIPSSMPQQPAFQQQHNQVQQHHQTAAVPTLPAGQPQVNHTMESKKVEAVPQQHHKEITVTAHFGGGSPNASVVDASPKSPQEPQASIATEREPEGTNAPASTSWASLFKKAGPPTPVASANAAINGGPPGTPLSMSHMMNNIDINAPVSGNLPGVVTAKRPVAKVSPFDGTNTRPSATPNSAPVNVKPANTATLSYSAASAQGLSTNIATPKVAPKLPVKPQADEWSLKLGEFFSKYKIDATSISIYPRGLVNRSNYCYINATLQALVSCPPFYHLIKSIPKKPKSYNRAPSQTPSSTPFIDAMIDLVQEFSLLPLSRINRDKTKKFELPEIQQEPAFEPVQIHKMLNGIRSDIFQVEGRQEDAEEFLGCVLNRLNDEILELIKLVEKPAKPETSPPPPADLPNGDQNGEQLSSAEDGDDWQVICGGRSNKGTITRTTDFGRTPISDIFGGKLRSRVHREGDHSTDNIQPFFTLQLDIEKATSVYQALENLVGRDQLEGVTCSKTNQEIAAWQQVTLEELPVVLILHLKCFDFKMDGCTKIVKTIDFPVELKIDSKIMSLSKTKYNVKQKTYKLFAVVYHDGKEASKGHYITDVFHVGYGHWIRYDDSVVKSVSENVVLHPQPPRVPYLLYYRRCDTFGTQTNANSNNNYHHHHK